MSDLKLPLSGDVNQLFRLWTTFFKTIGSQFGFINISLGKAGNEELEAEVFFDVASYGRQLGRVQDVLAVLLTRLPPRDQLEKWEQDAVDDFKTMFNSIADVKARRTGKPALRFKHGEPTELELR